MKLRTRTNQPVEGDELDNLKLSGDLEVAEDSEVKIFENIVDSEGHKVYKYFDGAIKPAGSEWANASLDYVSSFVKVIRNYGELQFIFNCRITNTSESAYTIPSDRRMCTFANLPTYLKAKVYAHNGNSCGEGGQGSIAFCSLFISASGGAIASANQRYANLYQDSSGNICFFNEGGSIEIGAGVTVDFEARISLAI